MRVSIFNWFSLVRRQRAWAPCALALIGLAGCGGNERVPLHPVRGQIFYDGKPVPHAHVVLHAVQQADNSEKNPPRPQAHVGSDGSFKVSTYEAGDGAPAGEYAVSVQWLLTSAKHPDAPPSNKLPVRYSLASTSGLRVQVREGDNQLPPLHLKK